MTGEPGATSTDPGVGNVRTLETGRFRRLGGSRLFQQAAIFTGSSGAVAVLGVVSTTLLARNLTTVEYGNYAFAVSLLSFSAMFFDFGFFPPAGRLAALAEGRERREVVGAALALFVPIGIAYCGTVLALSFVVDSWFHTTAGDAVRLAALVAIAVPFGRLSQQLAQGSDRLHVYSLTSVLFQGLFVALVALAIVAPGLGVRSGLFLRMSAMTVAAVVAAVWLRPLFSQLQRHVRELARNARSYGVQIYLGHLMSIGTYNMDVLMLGAWADPRSVGLYTLAGSLAAAGGLPVMGVATALFAPLARERRIAPRWILLATVMGVVTSTLVWLLAEPFIRFVFSERYADAARLVLPLTLAQAVRGVTSIYNTFLSAKGRGREQRNAAIVLTASNVILNFALIPPFGAMGAAWASLFALIANLAAHVYSYRTATNALSSEAES